MNTTQTLNLPKQTLHLLAFQAVQIADNYSEEDVNTLLSVLSETEKQALAEILSRNPAKETNDRIMYAISSIIDIAYISHVRAKRKISSQSFRVPVTGTNTNNGKKLVASND